MLIWCWYDAAISIAFQWQQNDTLSTSLYQCWYSGDTSTLKRYRHRVTESDGFVNTKTMVKNDVETMHKLWLIFYREALPCKRMIEGGFIFFSHGCLVPPKFIPKKKWILKAILKCKAYDRTCIPTPAMFSH